jgi:hypothetical protein
VSGNASKPIYIGDVLATACRVLTSGHYESVRLSLEDRQALAAAVIQQHDIIVGAGLSYPTADRPDAKELAS